MVAADVVGFADVEDEDVEDEDAEDEDVEDEDVDVVVDVVVGVAVASVVDSVVAESSPPPEQAAMNSAAQQIKNRVVRPMTQIYQARGGVRSRGEGA